MNNCVKCDKEIPSGLLICPHCGTIQPLPASAEENTFSHVETAPLPPVEPLPSARELLKKASPTFSVPSAPTDFDLLERELGEIADPVEEARTAQVDVDGVSEEFNEALEEELAQEIEQAEAIIASEPEKRSFFARARLSRAERKAQKKAEKDAAKKRKEIKKSQREQQKSDRKTYRSITRQLRDRDRELSAEIIEQRERRSRAKDVYDFIGFERMYKNGLCEVEEGLYSETIKFSDVSYQSARDEDQRAILYELGDMLVFFGPNSTIQYTLINRPLPEEEIGHRRFFDEQGENAELAKTYNEILNQKMLEGSSNMVRSRYITYATGAEDPRAAVRSLARLRSNVFQTFSGVGANPSLLNGVERLDVINSITRPLKPLCFDFDRDLTPRSPITAKDFVCPASFDFRPQGEDATCFMSDDMWCQVLVMRPDFAPELTDRCIAAIMDRPIPMVCTWHIQPIDRNKAKEMMRSQLGLQQAEMQDADLQAGYNPALISRSLKDNVAESDNVLTLLVDGGENLFYYTGLIMTYAKTREELNNQVVEIVSTAKQEGIHLDVLKYRQQEGLNSCLPLANNHVSVSRDFTTSELAIFTPFTTQEIDMEGGGYYGQNRESNNLVIVNRRGLNSPHGVIAGMTRSGKSFAIKREITNTVLEYPTDEIYMMDGTGEYSYITRLLNGLELAFGPDIENYVNPFDLSDVEGLSSQAALMWKIDAFYGMTNSQMGEGNEDLTQVEKSIISRCVEEAFRYARELRGENSVPTLGEFVEVLKATDNPYEAPYAQKLALMYERYVVGPLSFLNHQTNIDLAGHRVINFNTKDVPNDMRVFVMLSNLEFVRNRMLYNHERGVSTWIYIDEFQALVQHPAIIDYLARLWREGAKFGLAATAILQEVHVLPSTRAALSIFSQSSFLLFMRQDEIDLAWLEENLGLSKVELGYLGRNTRRGQGLLVADAAKVPFTDDFPKDNVLYDAFSTSPEEYLARLEREKERSA